MRLPLDRLWPSAYRWLQVLHLEHLIELRSTVRVMLMISCGISLSYSVAWLMDIVQLSCFTNTPWKEEGIGRWTCLFYLLGGIALAFMFQHSAMALAYYDEDGDALRERKERFLDEMHKQTGHVLARATNQAQKLCGLLSADLGDKVNEHVFRMQKILQKIERGDDPEAKRIYDHLATQMAHHLHNLRQPALTHFEKLIKLSNQTHALRETLRQERQQSMVALLTGKSAGVPRTATLHGDVEDGVLKVLDEIVGTKNLHDAFCCGCCFPRGNSQVVPPVKRERSIDGSFIVPTEADMHDQLRPIPLEDRERFPEKVVLRPLRLVLRWFEKIEPRHDAGGGIRFASVASEAMAEARGAADKLAAVVEHLRGSSFYRCILFGICCSLGLFAFYAHMLYVCIDVMRKGDCHGQLIVACFMAAVRKIVGMCAMSCYAWSLSVVLWNVERLDAVLQVQEEIHEIEDFKRQVDRLNAHELAAEDSSLSIIQTVERALAEQKRIVASFFNNAFGESVPLSAYNKLADDLEAKLNGRSRKSGCGAFGRPYRRLAESDAACDAENFGYAECG